MFWLIENKWRISLSVNGATIGFRFGVKPLPDPLPNYCQMDPHEQTSVKLRQKYKSFQSKITFEKLLLKTSAILFWYQYVRPVMLNTCNIAACTEPVVNQNLCLYNGHGSCDSSITMTTHIKYSWLCKNGYKVGMLHMKHYSRLTYCVMNFYQENLISFTCIHYVTLATRLIIQQVIQTKNTEIIKGR